MARRCGASFLSTLSATQTVARTPEDYVQGMCVHISLTRRTRLHLIVCVHLLALTLMRL